MPPIALPLIRHTPDRAAILPVLVETGAQGGPENMALDGELLRLASQGAGPFVRFYGWKGPWISLGWFQDVDEAIDACGARERGIGLVRRPTGGKAILHDGDLSYSICVPPWHPVARMGVIASHRVLARPIADALLSLGIDAMLAPDGPSPGRASVPCFLEKAPETVVVGGRKLAGAAQLRRGGALLEHGSIPMVAPDPARLVVLSAARSAAMVDRFLEETTWVSREKRDLSEGRLKACLFGAFARRLRIGGA